LNQFVDFYEVQYGGHVIEGDLDAIHFNPVSSSISKWQLKVNILFYGDNAWTVAVSQMKFGAVEDHGHTYKFYFIHYFV
jgi:hypothetical protein